MGVFICYRRDDAEGEARALYARLAEETDESKLFLASAPATTGAAASRIP
jgi:hypothetical protein